MTKAKPGKKTINVKAVNKVSAPARRKADVVQKKVDSANIKVVKASEVLSKAKLSVNSKKGKARVVAITRSKSAAEKLMAAKGVLNECKILLKEAKAIDKKSEMEERRIANKEIALSKILDKVKYFKEKELNKVENAAAKLQAKLEKDVIKKFDMVKVTKKTKKKIVKKPVKKAA